MTEKRQEGFTLIELMVVIAIIGTLSSVALTSLNGARVKARDTKRRSELNQILLAFEQNYAATGVYLVPGTGWGGGGQGWFNYEGTNYTKSIANGLQERGYFPVNPIDPQIPRYQLSASGTARQYMVYSCNNRGIYIYAHLERPTAEDQATYTQSKALGCSNLDTYTMNYAVGRLK